MYEVSRSGRQGKKWQVETPSGKTVHFGASGYQDYTQHKDEGRKSNYLSRHGGGKENWRDKESAGYWARWLLWEKPSVSAAARALRQKGVNVRVRK